jgi:hypothetical protein
VSVKAPPYHWLGETSGQAIYRPLDTAVVTVPAQPVFTSSPNGACSQSLGYVATAGCRTEAPVMSTK